MIDFIDGLKKVKKYDIEKSDIHFLRFTRQKDYSDHSRKGVTSTILLYFLW